MRWTSETPDAEIANLSGSDLWTERAQPYPPVRNEVERGLPIVLQAMAGIGYELQTKEIGRKS